MPYCIRNGELMHYGVRGMKWGVRRYQNYDGTRIKQDGDAVIKRGTTLTRLTNDSSKKIASGVYVAKNKDDVYQYGIDAATGMLGLSNEKSIFRKEIRTLDDAKVRRGRAAVEDFLKEYGDETLNRAFKTLDRAGYFDDSKNRWERHKIWTKTKQREEARRKLGSAAHKQIYKNRDEYMKKYRDKGYDAFTDPEDFVWNYNTPMIVVNPDKFEVSNVRDVTDELKKHRKQN